MARGEVNPIRKEIPLLEVEKRIKDLKRLYFIKFRYQGNRVERAASYVGITKKLGYIWQDRWNTESFNGLIPKLAGGRPMINGQLVHLIPDTIVDIKLRREFKIAYPGPNNMGSDKSVLAYWGEEVPYRHMRIRGRHGIAIFFSEGIEFREFSTSSDPVDDSHKGEGLLKWDISVEKQRVRDVIKERGYDRLRRGRHHLEQYSKIWGCVQVE